MAQNELGQFGPQIFILGHFERWVCEYGTSIQNRCVAGEKPKTPKHADNYFGIDAYAESSKKDSEIMASSLDKIVELVAKSSVPTETPTKKKQRQLKDLTENIRLLLEEKSNLKKSEESTEDVDAQLRILREERMMLNSARGPGSTANLTDAFNDAA